MERRVDTRPNNPGQYHPSTCKWQAYCCLSEPLVCSLCTYASSLLVVYSNVVWMEQLVVTRGWLCCSHSDIFKDNWGKRHCCLQSVDDSTACYTSSTVVILWLEGSALCWQEYVLARQLFKGKCWYQGIWLGLRVFLIKLHNNETLQYCEMLYLNLL